MQRLGCALCACAPWARSDRSQGSHCLKSQLASLLAARSLQSLLGALQRNKHRLCPSACSLRMVSLQSRCTLSNSRRVLSSTPAAYLCTPQHCVSLRLACLLTSTSCGHLLGSRQPQLCKPGKRRRLPQASVAVPAVLHELLSSTALCRTCPPRSSSPATVALFASATRPLQQACMSPVRCGICSESAASPQPLPMRLTWFVGCSWLPG